MCDCGNEKDIPANSVKSGLVKSCGCIAKPHGQSGTRLYNIWVDMRQRCSNPRVPNYNDYGGRGISVCEPWSKKFVSFRDWAIANGYSDNLSIDRINVNGNYEPSNCRWATDQQQAMNTRKTRLIEIGGVTKPLKEWCSIYGIEPESVYRRIRKYKIEFSEAITMPRLRRRHA